MIAAAKPGSKNLVIGLTTGDANMWKKTNAALKAAYGDDFIDAKAYLSSEQALTDAGITPTAADRANIASGKIADSLLSSDGTHFNETGYFLLGRLVYSKLRDRGYISARTPITTVKDIHNAAELAAINPSYSKISVEYGVGGRRNDDAAAAIDFTGVNGSGVAQEYANYDPCSITTINTEPFAIAISIYPTPEMTYFKFARGGSEDLSSNITPNMLEMNKWNRLVLFHDPVAKESELYINGVKTTTACKQTPNASRTNIRLITKFPKGSTARIYYDDIAVYTGGSFLIPAVFNSQYSIEDKYINKWGGDTVGALKNKISLVSPEYSINVYSGGGTLKQDSDALAADDNVEVCFGSAAIERYYMGAENDDSVRVTKVDALIKQYRGEDELKTISADFTTVGTQGGVGGRRADDISAKLTYVGDATGAGDGEKCSFDIPIDSAYADKSIAATVDIYPNSHIGGFAFETGGGLAVSGEVPASALNKNEWNRISLSYSPAERTSTLYVNGVKYESYGNDVVNPISQNTLRLTCRQDKAYKDAGEVFYLDDIAVYSGSVIYPVVEAGTSTISDKNISEWAGITVGAFVKTIPVTSSACAVNVCNAAGAKKADSDMMDENDKINICTEDILLEEYYPAPLKVSELISLKDDYSTLKWDTWVDVTTEGGVGGRDKDDISAKIIGKGTSKANYAKIVVADYRDITEKPYVLSVSVYPSDTMASFQFNHGAQENLCAPITNLNKGEWNKIVLHHNPKTMTSVLYVNGVYTPTTVNPQDAAKTRNDLKFCTNFSTAAASLDTVFYLDDIQLLSGTLVMPLVKESSLNIDKNTINGWKSKTVGDITDKLTLASQYYSVKVVDETGTQKSAGEELKAGDVVQVMCSDVVIDTYTLGVASYSVLGDAVLYNNGYVPQEPKFGKGTVTVKQPIAAYGESPVLRAILAQYDSDNRLINISTAPQSPANETEVSVSIDITRTQGTKLRYFLFEGMRPVVKPVEFEPYSEVEIQSVTPLYEGYTTKSATFSYDDGTQYDQNLIDIFDKYGAKGTFNLISNTREEKDLAPDGTSPQTVGVMKQQKELYEKAVAGGFEGPWTKFVAQTYADHEISSHTKNHWASGKNYGETHTSSFGVTVYVPKTEELAADIQSGVTELEGFFGEYNGNKDVIGLAWPNGYGYKRNDYEASLKPAMEEVGIKYARAEETYKFDLPTDWYKWGATCHHKDAPGMTKQFIDLENSGDMKCFYVWGHAYEFNNAGTNDALNWKMIEGVVSDLAAQNNVWFATNGQIYSYVEAARKLEITKTSVKNPSDMTVYCQINGQNVELAAGASYELKA